MQTLFIFKKAKNKKVQQLCKIIIFILFSSIKYKTENYVVLLFKYLHKTRM